MTEGNRNLSSTEEKTNSFSGLFDNLSHVIAVSRKKFDLQRASNSDKMKWGRLIVQGCEAYGRLLEASKLEAIEARLERLETKGQEG